MDAMESEVSEDQDHEESKRHDAADQSEQDNAAPEQNDEGKSCSNLYRFYLVWYSHYHILYCMYYTLTIFNYFILYIKLLSIVTLFM